MSEGLLPGKYRELQPSTSAQDANILPKALKSSPALFGSFVALLALSGEIKGHKSVLVVHRSPLRLELYMLVLSMVSLLIQITFTVMHT